MRHVLLHHHFFKNAGTSLDYSLKLTFQSRFATVHDPNGDCVTGDMLMACLAERPHLQALSSHHFHGEMFADEARSHRLRLFHLALIRRPIDRIVSAWKFFQRTEDMSPVADAARSMTLAEYLSYLIAHHPYLVNDAQVNLFANSGFYARPVSQADFDVARERLATFALCGTVERYDDAMISAEYFISPSFQPDGLDLSYVRQNVSDYGADRGDLGADNLAWLTEHNQFDEQLHRFATKELDRRIGLIRDIEHRRVSFVRRCDALRP